MCYRLHGTRLDTVPNQSVWPPVMFSKTMDWTHLPHLIHLRPHDPRSLVSSQWLCLHYVQPSAVVLLLLPACVDNNVPRKYSVDHIQHVIYLSCLLHNTHSLQHMRVKGGGDNAQKCTDSKSNITCLYGLQHMTAREGGDNTQYKASSNAHVHFDDIVNSNLQPHALMGCTVYVFKDTRPCRIVTKRYLKKNKQS